MPIDPSFFDHKPIYLSIFKAKDKKCFIGCAGMILLWDLYKLSLNTF